MKKQIILPFFALIHLVAVQGGMIKFTEYLKQRYVNFHSRNLMICHIKLDPYITVTRLENITEPENITTTETAQDQTDEPETIITVTRLQNITETKNITSRETDHTDDPEITSLETTTTSQGTCQLSFQIDLDTHFKSMKTFVYRTISKLFVG